MYKWSLWSFTGEQGQEMGHSQGENGLLIYVSRMRILLSLGIAASLEFESLKTTRTRFRPRVAAWSTTLQL
jgi:hypothetical protein